MQASEASLLISFLDDPVGGPGGGAPWLDGYGERSEPGG